uniref:Uncharacterized protein n=1 Tax=Chinchilla lanigera TaxID=34839 RepID=A0A8C2W5U4_CHILA
MAVFALLLSLLGVAWLGGTHSWGVDMPSMQKRADVATQFSQPDAGRQVVAGVTPKNYYNNQQAYPTVPSGQHSVRNTPKQGVATASSSASRAQPGLLHWLKFW